MTIDPEAINLISVNISLYANHPKEEANNDKKRLPLFETAHLFRFYKNVFMLI